MHTDVCICFKSLEAETRGWSETLLVRLRVLARSTHVTTCSLPIGGFEIYSVNLLDGFELQYYLEFKTITRHKNRLQRISTLGGVQAIPNEAQ